MNGSAQHQEPSNSAAMVSIAASYLNVSGNEGLMVLHGLFHDAKNDGIEMQIQKRKDAMHGVSKDTDAMRRDAMRRDASRLYNDITA